MAWGDEERREAIETQKMMTAGVSVGAIVFLATWAYCAASYGFLLAFVLGWIPSALMGGIAFAVVAYRVANRR